MARAPLTRWEGRGAIKRRSEKTTCSQAGKKRQSSRNDDPPPPRWAKFRTPSRDGHKGPRMLSGNREDREDRLGETRRTAARARHRRALAQSTAVRDTTSRRAALPAKGRFSHRSLHFFYAPLTQARRWPGCPSSCSFCCRDFDRRRCPQPPRPALLVAADGPRRRSQG